MSKSFLLSKTFWFNLLALGFALANAFGYGDFQPDPAVEQIALVVITVINLILRFATTHPVHIVERRRA